MRLRPRRTAYKVHISDLYAGKYTRERSGAFLETSIGAVVRVRLLGTVVARYESPKKSYTSLTLDDATDTIHIKAWGENAQKIADYQVGDIIDVVGKVREQEDGERFISYETVIKVEDVNMELLRELEIIELHQVMDKKNMIDKEPETVSQKETKSIDKITPEKQHETVTLTQHEFDVKDEIMRLIQTLDEGRGAPYREIVEHSAHIGEDAVETAILDLLNEGVIYEPEPGRYKEL